MLSLQPNQVSVPQKCQVKSQAGLLVNISEYTRAFYMSIIEGPGGKRA